MNVCIFEDFFIPSLSPVNYLRHTSEIICGALTIKEKIEKNLKGKNKFSLHSRKSIEDYCKEKFPGINVNEFDNADTLFLNSRVLFNEKNLKQILKSAKNEKNIAWVKDKFVAAFFTSAENTIKIGEVIRHDKPEYLVSYSDIEWLGLKKIESPEFNFINYAPDAILFNDEEL